MSNYNPEKSGEISHSRSEQMQLAIAQSSGELAVSEAGREGVGEEDFIEILNEGLPIDVGTMSYGHDDYIHDLLSFSGPLTGEMRLAIAERLVAVSQSTSMRDDLWVPAIKSLAEELSVTDDNIEFKQQELLTMLKMGFPSEEEAFGRVNLLIEAGQADVLVKVKPLYDIYGIDKELIVQDALQRGLDPLFDQSVESFSEMDWADSVVALRAHTNKMTRQGKQPSQEFVEALTKHAFNKLHFNEGIRTRVLPIGAGLDMLKRANPEITDEAKYRQEFFRLRAVIDANDIEPEEMDKSLLSRCYKEEFFRRVNRVSIHDKNIDNQIDKDIEYIKAILPESFSSQIKEDIGELIDQSYDPEAMAYFLKIVSSKEVLDKGPEFYTLMVKKMNGKKNIQNLCHINPANIDLLSDPVLVERVFGGAGTDLTCVSILKKEEVIKGRLLTKVLTMAQAEELNSGFFSFDHLRHTDQFYDESINEDLEKWIELFEGVDLADDSKVIDILLDSEFFSYVPRRITSFSAEVKNYVADRLISMGEMGLSELASYLQNFSDLESSVATELVNRHPKGTLLVANNLRKFANIDIQAVELMASNKRVNLLRLIEEIQEKDPKLIPDNLQIAYEMFGDNISTDSYCVVKSIMNGDLNNELLNGLGVDLGGMDGLNQLKQSLKQFAEPIFKKGEIPAEATENPLLFDYLKGIVRFKVKGPETWGERKDEELKRILSLPEQKVGDAYQYGEIKVSKAKLIDFKIPKDAAEELEKYVYDIVDLYGKSAFQNEKALFSEESLQEINSKIIDRQSKLQAGIEAIETKIAKGKATDKDIKSLYSLKAQKEVVSKLSIEEEKDVTDNLAALAKYKENHDFLRKVLIGSAMRNASTGISTEFIISLRDPASFEAIPKIKDYVGHQIVQEALANSMGKNDMKIVKKLLSTKALDHAIKLHTEKQSASSNTTTFGMLPTRGALMELSGHLGDICWASKYDSIAQAHPNVTAVVMIKNPSKANQKFAGASLLIETESDDGEKLLVIRGLNPLQTEINMLNQKSFVDNFTEYARQIADASGRKLAIAIDGGVGGTATNRPQLFEYLASLKKSLVQVKVPKDNTTVNGDGYSIRFSTYLV